MSYTPEIKVFVVFILSKKRTKVPTIHHGSRIRNARFSRRFVVGFRLFVCLFVRIFGRDLVVKTYVLQVASTHYGRLARTRCTGV